MRRLPLLFPLLLALAACGTTVEPGGASEDPPGLPVGRAFLATGATDGGRPRQVLGRVGIEFRADGTAWVATGCNGASGHVRLQGGRLVGDGFAITEMACLDPGVNEQQAFVMSVVDAEPELVLDGDVLVLRTAAAEIRFLDQKVADPDRPLQGTRWQITTVFDAKVASSVASPPAELVLSASRLRFTGPCHDVEGPATVAGSAVTIGPLVKGPGRPCNEDARRAEDDALRLLTGWTRATVQARTLRLEREDGRGLAFVEASTP